MAKVIWVSGFGGGDGKTMNLGRNERKRQLRKGLPRKKWPSLANGYGYPVSK